MFGRAFVSTYSVERPWCEGSGDTVRTRPMASHLRSGWAADAMPVGFLRRLTPRYMFMEALLTSTVVVALAEVGAKTQLLAIVLAPRLQRPWPIICDIFAATTANTSLTPPIGEIRRAR